MGSIAEKEDKIVKIGSQDRRRKTMTEEVTNKEFENWLKKNYNLSVFSCAISQFMKYYEQFFEEKQQSKLIVRTTTNEAGYRI